MASQLVALDKQPGTRPVRIGEILRHLMAKCVLKACGRKAMQACGTANICARLPVGIEGAVHALASVGLEPEPLQQQQQNPTIPGHATTTTPEMPMTDTQ